MCLVELPWGVWRIVSRGDVIVEILPADGTETSAPTKLEYETGEQLMDYAYGKRKEFSVCAQPNGTEFQKTVWKALCQVPYGATISYGHLAAKIGRPTAARAVAQAVGANPCLVVIPCHRVLGADGSLTGFSEGLALKRALLSVEGISWKE